MLLEEIRMTKAVGGGVVVLEGVALLVAMKCQKLLVAVW
jgi:hypothetical protein